MAASDMFPVDPDYTVTRSLQANLLRGRLESGREFRRQKAAPPKASGSSRRSSRSEPWLGSRRTDSRSWADGSHPYRHVRPVSIESAIEPRSRVAPSLPVVTLVLKAAASVAFGRGSR